MIKDIILKQKEELANLINQYYIQRNNEIKSLNENLIKIVTGPRRAGKSFFIIHSLGSNLGYVNFDDERLTKLANYDDIVAMVDFVYSHPKIIFFDEIQNLPNWELFVNRLQRNGRNIILSGSNSNLLSGELATHLTGRYLETKIFPLSFKEIINELKYQTSADIKGEFEKYLINGGYPEPFIKKIEITDYLKTLFEATIYKDVIKRYKLRKPFEIEAVAEFLISNVATQISYNQIAKSLGVKSIETIKKYYKILEESMLFFSINKFSYKLREQHFGPKKIYCVDNGMIKAKAFAATYNIGKLYENLVAIALKISQGTNGTEIFYWKNSQNNEEVDFVVKKENKIQQLIQVSYSLENKKTEDREIRALLKASRELNCSNLVLINASEEKEEEREWFGINGKIKYIPIWKWLLNY